MRPGGTAVGAGGAGGGPGTGSANALDELIEAEAVPPNEIFATR